MNYTAALITVSDRCSRGERVDTSGPAIKAMLEAMRAASVKSTPRGMLSRGIAGLRGGTLIVNLPGSEKAAKESLEAVLPALKHGVDMLRGLKNDCATQHKE